MTKEEMIFFLNECAEDLEVDHNLEIWGMKMEEKLQECADAFRAGAKALEQESILDKIRTEIETDLSFFCFDDWGNETTEWKEVKAIIDKYKEESDEEEIGKEILSAMKESAEAIKNSPHYDFSCVTPLLDEGVEE